MQLLGNTTAISILNDPFNAARITGVSLRYRKFCGEGTFSGHVEFKNGNTDGRQNFDAANFDELIVKVKAFIESLPKEVEKPGA